jgi:uncharacterized membrane protein YqjE
MEDTRADDPQPGLVASLSGLARNLSGLFASRIELASLELGELRDSLVQLLLAGAAGVVALWFALTCWTALVIVLAWETLGWKILLLVAAAYTILAFGILLYVRAQLRRGRLSLPATMEELRKDREALL